MSDLTPYLSGLSLPCYVYDLNNILERINLLKKNLPDNIDLYYAVKANSNLQLLKSLLDNVDGLDISSGGELEQALLAGYSPENFSFAGPGKTAEELELAIKSACGSISAESFDDLARIDQTAQKLGQPAFVSLRINPAKLNESFAMKMGGKPTQFGFDEEELTNLPELKNSKIIGLHIYAGTQCLKAAGLSENFADIFALAEQINSRLNLNIKQLNIGGGFGIDYFAGQQPLDIQTVCQALSREAAPRGDWKIILELGRYLVAPAGYYLAQVLNIKHSRGKTFAIIDGGMHHNQAAAGNLGQIIKKNYKITNLSNPVSEKLKVELTGCLCTPLDTIAAGLEISEPRIGDILCIHNSGAYGYTASPLLFLGHPTAPEYLLENRKIRLIRSSKKLTDFN